MYRDTGPLLHHGKRYNRIVFHPGLIDGAVVLPAKNPGSLLHHQLLNFTVQRARLLIIHNAYCPHQQLIYPGIFKPAAIAANSQFPE